MYGNKDARNKIYKQVEENKKKQAEKIEKDKIIKEELQKVQSFLKESKQGKRKLKDIPEDHYSRLINDKRILGIYDNMIKKQCLSLTEKEQLLECTFQIIK